MQFGALGDIHGDFESVRRIMRAHADIPFWLCVGDLPNDGGEYEPVPLPLYWIKGNNEDFNAIADRRFPANLHYIPNATLIRIEGLAVAGLGGTLAPTWYDTAAADLPYPEESRQATAVAPRTRASSGGTGGSAVKTPRVRDDKRRHFVREEVETCKAMRGVDVLLTHEAPRPYVMGHGAGGARGHDAGKTPINEVLATMHPRLHLFGHHHRFSEQERQGVRSVGLDLVSRSYLLVDGETLEYRLLTS
jgi:hypothetical protein